MKMKAMDPQTRKPPTITIPISTRRSHSSNYYDSSSTTPTPSHLESPHSPLRFHSPLHSDHGDPPDHSPYASPDPSPPKQRPPDSSKAVSLENVPKFSSLRPHRLPSPETSQEKPSEAVVVLNRAVREDGAPAVRKVGPGGEREGGKERAVTAILRRSRRGEVIRMVELGFRVCEFVFCLISFSVMAADKTRGWSGDSFDRYIEYRYCLSVNVIACIYSGFQANDLAYHLITGKHVLNHHLRYHFVFFMDQILAYLLISASSSAATRVDDWQSNWGKDDFTIMASASVAMAFLAFAAFAISSLISGYNLCNREEA